MSEKTEEQQVLEAVKTYAELCHSHMQVKDIWGFSDEQLDRLKTENGGDLVYIIDAVEVDSVEEKDGETIWYVSATVCFQVNDGGDEELADPDIYLCKRAGSGWDIQRTNL